MRVRPRRACGATVWSCQGGARFRGRICVCDHNKACGALSGRALVAGAGKRAEKPEETGDPGWGPSSRAE